MLRGLKGQREQGGWEGSATSLEDNLDRDMVSAEKQSPNNQGKKE